MKKFYFIAICLVIILSGCQKSAVTMLELDIKESNEDCPIEFGDAGYITHFEYNKDQNCVFVYISLDNDFMTVEDVNRQRKAYLDMFKLGLSSEDSKEFMQLVMDADAGLKIIFSEASDPDKTAVLKLSLDDIKDIRNTKMSDSNIESKIFEKQLAVENSKCPQQIDEGMYITRVTAEGSNVVYTVEVDEDLYDTEFLQAISKELKEAISEGFTDDDGREMIEFFVENKKGLVYRLVGNRSHNSLDIKYSPSELEYFTYSHINY